MATEKKLPPQILFGIGDRVKANVEIMRGVVKDVELREVLIDAETDERAKWPHYLVAYRDPETGDADEREFVNGQIADDVVLVTDAMKAVGAEVLAGELEGAALAEAVFLAMTAAIVVA